MRERTARRLALLTGLIVVVLSAAFGYLQNPTSPAPSAPSAAARSAAPTAIRSPADATQLARGRALFDEQSCTACHSIAGVGNPRNPLDGVGGRRGRDQLRAWIVGAVAPQLPQRTLRIKSGYADLPPDDLTALITFLASLDDDRKPQAQLPEIQVARPGHGATSTPALDSPRAKRIGGS